MEPIPLIPEISSEACPDTSYILREEFQDILGEKTFPIEVLTNLKKSKPQNNELLHCAHVVNEVCNETEDAIEELTEAEEALLKSQAEFIRKATKETDVYTYKKTYPKADNPILQKFSLLREDDLLSNSSGLSFCPPRSKAHKIEESATSNKIKYIKKRKKCSPRKEFDQKLIKKEKVKKEEKKKWVKPKEKVFVAEPNRIIIKNYKKNILYEEYFTLRNISSTMQSFFTPIVKQPSDFSVILMSRTQNIAPGLSAKFLVSFITNKFMDRDEELTITVPGGDNVIIHLMTSRLPPRLKGLVYYNIEDVRDLNFQGRDKDYVLNDTVDCGSCLLGSTAEIKFIFKNVGGDGSFFLMSEEDWLCYDVIDITEKFKLCMQDFTLRPVYFELDTNEIKELTITYNPIECGFSVDKFYLLCDNNTMKEVDIIGDCQMYNRDCFLFEFGNLHGTKDSSSDCNCLDLGYVYNNQKVIHAFTVCNNSSLRIEFAWKIYEIEPEDGTDIYSLKEEWIAIYPRSGCFESYSRKEFELHVLMNTNQNGVYSCRLNLYVLNIPKQSLPEYFLETITNENQGCPDSNLWNIEVKEFSILLKNVPIEVGISPKVVNLGKSEFNVPFSDQMIQVSNNGHTCLNFEWKSDKIPERMCAVFEPSKFTLSPNNTMNCILKVTPLTSDNFDEIFILSINDDFEKMRLRIRGTVKQSCITVLNDNVNFGIVRKDAFKNITIPIKNNSDALLFWEALEITYDFEARHCIEIEDTNLSYSSGELDSQEYDEVEYTLDTSIPREYFSIIFFYTIHESAFIPSGFTIVTGRIMQPVIRIINDRNSEEIFNIKEVYILNDTIEFEIYLNNESLCKTKYVWNEPVGANKDMLKVTVNRNRGKLDPWSRKLFRLNIQFLEPGLINDLYVPVTIDGLEEPVYLQICCRVKEPQYVISLPIKDRYIDVLWPYPVQDIEDVSMVEQDEIKDSDNDITEYQYEECEETQASDVETTVCSEQNKAIDDETNNENILYTNKDVLKYLEDNKPECEFESGTPSLVSSNTLTERDEIDSDKTIKSDSISTIFESSSSISEYVLEYLNVPCKEVHRKSIYIQNPSNVTVKFKIFVKNFCEKETENINMVEESILQVRHKMMPEENQQFSKKLSDHGIIVVSKPNSGDIKREESFKIDICVYAETWGYYLEEIGIQIENLPLFSINLIIQIVGLPIEYPALLHPYVHNPTIKFGTAAYNSNPVKRIIKIHNNSTIPYVIIWHLFTKDLEKSSSVPPFNMLLDFFSLGSLCDKMNCKMRITKYFGKESFGANNLFQITPRELYFFPKKTRELTITFTPPPGRDILEAKKTEALVVGHIYIDEAYSYCSNIFKRNPAKDLQAIQIYLNAELECPFLDFEHVRGKSSVSLSVEDILNKVKTEETFCLVFKNNSRTTTLVSVKVEKPFEIISAISSKSKQSKYAPVIVYSGNCMEVTLKCTLSYEFIMELADVFYKDVIHNLKNICILENHCMSITRSLDICLQSGLKQSLLLKAILSFPQIEISTSRIDFGNVCVGSQQYMTISLLNKTNMETKFIVSVSSKCVYSVEPSHGYLLPKNQNDKAVYITVYFRPRDTVSYQDTMIIETCLPQYKYSVQLIGEGTYDQKYYGTKAITK